MTTLEELLAQEGFRGRKSSGMSSRASFRADSASHFPFQDKHKKDSPSSSSGQRPKGERIKPDLIRHKDRSNSSRISRESLSRREKFEGRSKTVNWDRLGRGVSNDVREDRRVYIDPREDAEVNGTGEIVEEEEEKVKDIYSDKGYSTKRSEQSLKGSGARDSSEESRRKGAIMYGKHSGNLKMEGSWERDSSEESRRKGAIIYGKHSGNLKMEGSGERDSSEESRRKGAIIYGRHSGNLNKQLLKYEGSGNGSRRGLQQPEISLRRSITNSKNSKSFEEDHPRPKHENVAPISSQVALDEVAVQAVVSILNGYIKRFFKDEEFRTMLHTNCFSSFSVTEMEQDRKVESKVITTLEQAIETVEKAAERASSSTDMKKATLQLSVITGLNSNESKDGHTSGIPNSSLSACAHVYLSVIYKLQKKDRISAKHLLQAFCDSSFLARSLWLPELWEYLFLPHLSHLRVWYYQEADSLNSTPNKTRKLELLDRVYNEILDSGTTQFAAYYKDWITEGVEAPSVPSICIPTMSFPDVNKDSIQDHSSAAYSPTGPFSPQPMVSKKLYESVFGRSVKPGKHEPESSGELGNFDISASCSDGSTSEVKNTLPYSSEIEKYSDEDTKNHSLKDVQDDTFLPDHDILSAAKEGWKVVKVSLSEEDLIEEQEAEKQTGDSNMWQEAAGGTEKQTASLHTRTNELALKSLAKSVFESQQEEDSGDLIVSTMPYSEIMNASSTYKEIHAHYDRLREKLSIASIPPDFICPLTGRLFRNPVTLETGQTFEREAITEWFSKGNRTCPVTGKDLECHTVPLTNSILKRVVNSWKSDHCSHLLSFASQIVTDSVGYESIQRDEATVVVIEELLTTFNNEERITNAKHLISLGGLEFLIRRFRLGDLEEKARMVTLLCCCMAANSGCRKQIVEDIDRQCLIELLHSKDPKFRGKAVLLLIEFFCLSRKKDSVLFLSGLQSEEIVNMMHILLVYLQSSPLAQRPSVAVLLLNLDLLSEPKKYSIYREEAIDAIAMALEGSLTNEEVCEECCKSLLILGGRFSASGKLLTESWVLKQAGFNSISEVNCREDDIEPVDLVPLEGEEEEYEEWLRNLSASLLGNGTRSFLETTSKCLSSKKLDLVRVCLTTVAWLSAALPSLSDPDFQLPAFSALISGLKESLENGEHIEHKVLASVSLLNFSKISECRVLLMTIAVEIAAPLRNIAEVTWTARQLYAIITGEDL